MKFIKFCALAAITAVTGCTSFSKQVDKEVPKEMPGAAYRDLDTDGAWCWFADPRAVTHEGKTYVSYMDREGSVRISMMDNETGEVTGPVILHKKLQRDDHDNGGIIIRPDGRILVFYSHHSWNGQPMFYRVSKNAGDITEWQPEQKITTNTKGPRGFCYGNPIQLSEEDNSVRLFWRGGNWKPTTSISTDLKNWKKAETFVQGKGRTKHDIRPYVKINDNGKDSFQIAFTDGHPRNEPQNSIYYARYRAGKVYKADGSVIGTMDKLPLEHRDCDVVYDGTKTGVRGWIWDVAEDKDGNPVVVYARLPKETEHVYHYARWDGKKWNDTKLCVAGRWFPQDKLPHAWSKKKREPEPHYSGGIILDHGNPNIVYLSRRVGRVFEIEKWETTDNGKTWKSTAITKDSTRNNVRPYVARGSNGEPGTLFWMYGHYLTYHNYFTGIKMNVLATPYKGETKAQTVDVMKKAADWMWNNRHEAVGGLRHDWDWTVGAWYAGVMELYKKTGDEKYLDQMISAGKKLKWKTGPRKGFADDHTIAQMFLEVYKVKKDPKMIAEVRSVFDKEIAKPMDLPLNNHYKVCFKGEWSWCDSLFMAPPVWAELSEVTGDPKYLERMNWKWWKTTNFLYDKDEHLYFRDAAYFKKKEKNGAKVFWSRGNGWVLGGLVRVLESMPKDYKDRAKYETLLKEMCVKLASIQQEDGFWRASLLDPASFPGGEVSGTGFFTYGIAWAINHGYLDKEKYLPVVMKGWKALVSAVHECGRVGWVQAIGADPRATTYGSTEVYGVGAFLLAGSEVMQLLEK